MSPEPRASVRRFAGVMEDVLTANDHKGGWTHCSNEYLLRRLDQEVAELRKAIANHAESRTIDREAADVANFAMMIAHNAGDATGGARPVELIHRVFIERPRAIRVPRP